MNVESKVYYLKETGKVIYVTSEFMGGVIKTTFEDDYNIVDSLNQYKIDQIDCMEIKYGKYITTFQNAKSYYVDLDSKELKVEYYTIEELENQNQEVQDLNIRVSDISDYLKEQKSESIYIFEDLIIQTELNKVMEGMN
jgi:helix-turn-helix protein